MKTFKKVLASALAAAMVVTAFPVTNAEAATKAKLSTKKATIYVGQSKTIKVTLPKGAKITSVKTSKKAVATVKKSGKKVVVKAVKAGKATVTVKVTPKKGKAKSLKATITVKNPALSLKAADVVAVGATEQITATVKPTNTKITFTSSDETIAKVDEKGVITGVKAGKVTITAKAGKTTKTVDMEVKNYVLNSVAQTKADTFEASVAGATKNIKTTDIVVKNTENNVIVPVKSVSVDSKDATKVTFTTFAGLTDGKTYDVTLDGTTKQVVVSNGTVASVSVDKVTIPVATETEIKLVAKDAQGVILEEVAYGAQDASKYDFTLTTNNGYVNSSKLFLNKVGDTATAEVTYKTGKYDANGKPEGNVTSGKVTITAVDQAAVNNFGVKIANEAAKAKKYDKIDANTQIAVGESGMYAYFQIKNADNNEVSNYYDYSVESSDKNVLMLDGSALDTANGNRILVTPVKAGTAYLLIKKDNKIVNSVAITVVAERAVATMDVDKTSATLSNKMTKTATVTASFKDQYGKDFMGDGSVKVTCLSTTAKDASDKAIDAKTVTENESGKYFTQNAATGNKVKVEFLANSIEAGTYQYKISYEKDSKEVCAKTVTIVIQKPADPAKGTESFALDVDKTEIDNLVDDNHTTAADYVVTASVNQLINGVANQAIDTSSHLKDGSTVKSISYKLEDKDGKNVTSTTGAAISGGKLTVTTVSFDGTKATKNFGAGTYKITATVVTTKDSKDTTKTFTSTFTVKDTQPVGSLSFEKNTVEASSVKDAVEKVVKFVYGDTTYSANANDTAPVITSIEGITSKGDKITKDSMSDEFTGEVTIKKVTFTVGTAKYSVDVTADASQVITIK